LVINSTNYPVGATYDDAGNVLTQTYPDGETVTNSYGSQGWLTGVSTSQGSTTLLSSTAYTGIGGASGFITSANLGGTTYQSSASFDLLSRATDIKVKRSSDQATMFDQTRTFDAAGNVSTANTTLPSGTDNQAFCYDEQNRLTWAGSTGTPPCTGTPISAGTLTAAQYTQTFAYDTMGRLTSGPLGAYAYGNSAHVHAATAVGSTYTAAYDAAGDMTCRAPSSSVTCNGTQTGAQLTYSNEGELSNWQNQPSSPTSTAVFLYDGQGNRVAQQSTQGGTTTTTVYVGNLEEDSTTGGTTTKTTFYYANGARVAMAVNGAFTYLASDGLGSANVALSSTGSATASTLYAPYGSGRYSSGTMPTDFGFTGQHADSITGLDYYNARYYDPTGSQFTSADASLPGNGFDVWGLSRYAYVQSNPVIRTDPSGNVMAYAGGGGGCYPCAPAPAPKPPAPQPAVWYNPFSWHWGAAASVVKQQVPAIHADPGGAQDELIALGRNLHGPARSFYVSALSTSRDWVGGETADLYSGDPGRVLRGTAGAVLFAANFVPGVGEGANLAKDMGEVALEEAISHAPGAEAAVVEGSHPVTALVRSEWPANRGFLGGPFKETLQPGKLIDRYGAEEGTFASPAGTPFKERGLPAYYEQTKPLSAYRVSAPIEVNAGATAPAFGMPGLGIQYELPGTVAELVQQGLLERVP
jgi:RHS repeat-associated protein